MSEPLTYRASTSYASASVTTSAWSPSMTARACLPEPPCDWLIVTRLAGACLPGLRERRVDVLIELACRVVRDVQQGHVLPGSQRRIEQDDRSESDHARDAKHGRSFRQNPN